VEKNKIFLDGKKIKLIGRAFHQITGTSKKEIILLQIF